jgi:hypothetical protein
VRDESAGAGGEAVTEGGSATSASGAAPRPEGGVDAEGGAASPEVGAGGVEAAAGSLPTGAAGAEQLGPRVCTDFVAVATPPTDVSADYALTFSGPDAPLLLTYSAPDRYWKARVIDGPSLGTVASVFDDIGIARAAQAPRAVIGYRHALFAAQAVNATTTSVRRLDVDTDTWSDALPLAGGTLALAVLPNGFLRLAEAANYAVALDTIPFTGTDVTTIPVETLINQTQMREADMLVDAEERGVIVALTVDQKLRGYVLREGQIAAAADEVVPLNAIDLSLVPLANGDTIAFWSVSNENAQMATLSYDEQAGTASWSPPVEIVDTPVSDLVAVGTPDGELTIAYAAVGGSFAKRFVDGAWSEPVQVGPISSGTAPAIAIAKNGAVAVVIEPSNMIESFALNVAVKGDPTWTASALDSGGGSPFRPTVAFDAADVPVVMWSRGRENGRREVVASNCH